ncbi:MAG: hypothetical protein ACREF5_00030 [Candidatus Saccharimonadales bacterium]
MKRLQIWLFKNFEIFFSGAIRAFYDHDHYQLSDQLLDWIEKNKDFRNSLKLRHPRRFRKIPYLITSHAPSTHPLHEDQIIGLWYVDLVNVVKKQQPYFKQDFIVNKKGKSEVFISFAQNNFVGGNYVESINSFFKKYGSNATYYHRGKKWEHHYGDIQDLPNTKLQELARKIIADVN